MANIIFSWAIFLIVFSCGSKVIIHGCSQLGCVDCYVWCTSRICNISATARNVGCRKSCGTCTPVELEHSSVCLRIGCTQLCDTSSTPGRCTCFNGYELQSDGRTCVDINECKRNSNLCPSPNAPRCKNTPGSYICTACGADSSSIFSYYNRTDCCKVDNAATCGTTARIGGRIMSGSMSSGANWPWTAYVTLGTSTCTGALIKPNVVLTAAHCIVRGRANRASVENMMVHLGVHNTSDTTNIHLQSYFVQNYVYHPQFDPYRLTNDVAILFLSQPADVSGTFVKTICLPNGEAPAVEKKCWVTGFGSLSEGGALHTTLQEVGLPIVSQQACVGAYQNHSKPVNWNSTFCAGYSEGGRDVGQGHWGGPLVCQRCNSCNWYLAGLVSYGTGCAREGFYGVYTRLTYFEQWISKQTQLTYSPRTCVRPSWGAWGAWTQTCPTCGSGTRTKTRTCLNGSTGDPGCDGAATITENCPFNPCSAESWGEFQAWTTCSENCGTGSQTRTRSCVGGLIGSTGCPTGGQSETQSCNVHNCPVWNDWSVWGACSESCAGGTREATRTCNTFGQAGATCLGSASKSEPCNTTPCPTWNAWVWSSCSATCGGGTRFGTRTCNKHGGTADCQGLATSTEVCEVGQCGSWSSWTNQGTCSADCGDGTQQQTRTCNGGTAGSGGCPGLTIQTITCNVQPCSQCSWTAWTDSGPCSVTCMKLQTRTCTGGTAGQAGCLGLTMQSIACTGDNCQPPTRCHLSTNAEGDYTCTQYAAFGYCVSYAVYMQANCAKTCCLANPSGRVCTGTDLYGASACQANLHQCSNAAVKLLCARACNPYC